MNEYDAVIECVSVEKCFNEGRLIVPVLKEINLTLARGERVAVVGSSGAGKSTLLHIMGGLDIPTKGEVRVGGRSMSSLNEGERSRLRNSELGFIYQFHHLLPEFTALENVAMPLLIAGLEPTEARHRASDVLAATGLSSRLSHKPGELSGGERQRAAVARALVTKPSCVLADEPTGNLDRNSASDVLDLMLNLNEDIGTSLVVVTHDENLAHRLGRVVRLVDGALRDG